MATELCEHRPVLVSRCGGHQYERNYCGNCGAIIRKDDDGKWTAEEVAPVRSIGDVVQLADQGTPLADIARSL